MRFLGTVLAFAAIGIIILLLADRLGFDTKFPRGAILLTLLDIAVIKGYLLIYFYKEWAK